MIQHLSQALPPHLAIFWFGVKQKISRGFLFLLYV